MGSMRSRPTMISALMRGSRNLRWLYSLVPYSSLLAAASRQTICFPCLDLSALTASLTLNQGSTGGALPWCAAQPSSAVETRSQLQGEHFRTGAAPSSPFRPPSVSADHAWPAPGSKVSPRPPVQVLHNV